MPQKRKTRAARRPPRPPWPELFRLTIAGTEHVASLVNGDLYVRVDVGDAAAQPFDVIFDPSIGQIQFSNRIDPAILANRIGETVLALMKHHASEVKQP
jgi:hypothetical protein